MAASDILPAKLIAGDTWKWTYSHNSYPVGTWTATWYFERAGATFSVVGTPSGNEWQMTVTAETTAGYAPGWYTWTLRVTSGSEAYVIESGRTYVAPNPAASGAYDTRTLAQKMVEQLEALALKRSLSGQTTVSVDGVSVTLESFADVIAALNFWRQQAKAEAVAAGLVPGGGRRVLVRFTRV
ncbi:MAG: hypothetical protein RML32_04145 [Gammaproteobacteria bacterium]|nr:hypothetical protein [Gammaproteobacteria bacterium]